MFGLRNLQFNIFLNSVPEKYSLYATTCIIIHTILGLTAAPLLLYLYKATGNSSDAYFLFVYGLLGTTLGILDLLALLLAVKITNIMLEFLLLLVYTIGAGYTTLVLNNGVFYLYQFNLLSIISPFMWIHLFFLLSGWYIFTLLLLTIYYCLTKERVKKCYGCRITYKKSDRYCEKCGTTIFYSFELKN